MASLEIDDTFEVYYDGRERFPHLPSHGAEVESKMPQRRKPASLPLQQRQKPDTSGAR